VDKTATVAVVFCRKWLILLDLSVLQYRFNRTVTPPLLCSSERQELHAGARPARHRWQDTAGKTPHDQPARSPTAADCATREAAEATLELDPFFIVRGCVSGVEVRTLAVA
jgi:hypothetical protein